MRAMELDLSQYIEAERGRQAALCKQIGAHAPDLSRWAKGERPVPIERCVPIERATGGLVTRRALRPADWHLIWPELVTKDHPAPEAAPQANAGA
jgi:DNA-binding transcriptional regulator YdaS (Cro superfamily)